MVDWWDRSIVEPGKLPLLLCLSALIVTFLVVRTITRRIRAGRGRLHDIDTGGVHLHHMVPGILLAVVSGLFVLSPLAVSGWRDAAAAVFGVGVGLVLDEFALIVYMHDVYWSPQGRASVEAIVLAAAFIGVLLVGVVPAGIDDLSRAQALARWVVVVHVAVTFGFLVAVLAKGKLGTGLAGLFVPGLAMVGAVRLARPNSPWAHRFYKDRPDMTERATRRTARFDARWRNPARHVLDLLGGTPDR